MIGHELISFDPYAVFGFLYGRPDGSEGSRTIKKEIDAVSGRVLSGSSQTISPNWQNETRL